MSSAKATTEVIINDIKDDSYMLDEFNIDDQQNGNCQNITCADATFSTIYLQDGQYFVSEDDNQTIILKSSHDDVNHYILNDEDIMHNPQVLEDIGMVRYYDEESGQIYYCKTVNEGDPNYIAVASENDGFVLADNEIVINSNQDLGENKSIKQLEQPKSSIHNGAIDMVDQNIVELPPGNELITSVSERTKYSYAVLKDGKLHLRTMEPLSSNDHVETEQDDRITAQLEALQQSISFDNPETVYNLGSITGKNLITGQVVTLDSYLKRLEKRKSTIQDELLRSPLKRQSNNHSISNRKRNDAKYKSITNRNTVFANGRKLKGKIVKIEKKQGTIELEKQENIADIGEQFIKQRNKEENENSNSSSTTSDTLQTLMLLKDAKEKVSSTLVSLMELESIRDQLKDKSIAIKLTEKTYDCNKNGYDNVIAYFYGRMMAKEKNEGKCWEFALIDKTTTEVNWTKNNVSNDPDKSMVCVYLLITTDKNGKKTSRVNIEHVPSLHCPFCNKTIETSMKVHLSQVHAPEIAVGFACSQCKLNFDSMTRLQKHLRIHSRSYRYECGTCNRKFTRHTNWQRHMDIHKSASEVAYHCDICGCGFNYASSLTRHIVQKHINKR